MQTTSQLRKRCQALVVVAGLLMGFAPPVRAQAGTDVFITEISRQGNTWQFGRLANVTDRPGYDNQPSFSPDGRTVLFTSIRDGQADAWLYDLERDVLAPITATPESEYSPTVMPGGTTISVIRVEMDSTQRLWRFSRAGRDPAVIFERIMPVGYHAWIDANTTAMFVLGRPATLQVGNVEMGTAETVASNVGRSIHKVPGQHAVIFLQRVSPEEAWITVYDLATRTMRRLVSPVPSSQDFAVMSDGTLLMGAASTLHAWRDGWNAWQVVADFTGQITGITRLAVSPSGDRLAVVGADP